MSDLDAQVTAARGGDAKAWEAVFRTVFPPVWGYVARRVKSGVSDVEDIVQETFLRVVRWMPSSYERGNFTGWCVSIARQCIAAHHRKRRLPLPDAGDVVTLLAEDGVTDEKLLRQEVLDTVGAALATLPAHYQRAIRLKYLDDVTFSELADRLALSESAARSRVMRAKEALRSALRSDAREGGRR
jgi:RNA polymerase sigma factor (sigma-70 family)